MNLRNKEVSLEPLLSFLALLGCALIVLRPLSFVEVGDFLVYLKGAEEAVENIDLYDPATGNFGSRYFNGPIMAWINSLFLHMDSSIALVIYRTIGIISTISIVLLLTRGKTNKYYVIGMVLLSFSSRMNVNLAQGAAIAALCIIVSIILITNPYKRFLTTRNVVAALLTTIAFNYKPQLTLLFMLYLLFVLRRYRFTLLFLIVNVFYETTTVIFSSNVSYRGWLKLLLSRNDKISDSGSSDVVGPYSAIWTLFDLPVAITFIIPAVLLVYFAKKLRSQNVREDLILLAALGTLVGPYSPAQDALLLTVLFITKINDLIIQKPPFLPNKIHLVRLPIFILACSTLSTRISFLNSLIILIVYLLILKLLNLKMSQLVSFLVLAITLNAISSVVGIDYLVYDIAGFGTFCMALWLVTIRFKRSI